jgi:hypothetical protein
MRGGRVFTVPLAIFMAFNNSDMSNILTNEKLSDNISVDKQIHLNYPKLIKKQWYA